MSIDCCTAGAQQQRHHSSTGYGARQHGGQQQWRAVSHLYVNVSVSVEFKVTLHEQVRYRGTLPHLTVLEVTVCHTAGHYGEEYDD